MQNYFNCEIKGKDLELKVTSQFAFSQYKIFDIDFCTPNNLKVRFWRGREALTIYLYSTIVIGVNDVVQVKYEDFIKQREGQIFGEVHKCFPTSRIKLCKACNKRHWGGHQPNCKWGDTCEKVLIEFASHFNIPEGACPYPERIPDINYKP